MEQVTDISYLSAAISICDKSMLVELLDKEIVLFLLLVVVVVNGGGCLMASTLQFKLLPILSWAIAILVTDVKP